MRLCFGVLVALWLALGGSAALISGQGGAALAQDGAENWAGQLICNGRTEGEIRMDLTRGGAMVAGRFSLTQAGADAPVLEFTLRAREVTLDPSSSDLSAMDRGALQRSIGRDRVATGLLLALDNWIVRPQGFEVGRFTAIDVLAGQTMDLVTGMCRNDPNALVRLVRTDAGETAAPGDALALAAPQDDSPPAQTGWEGQWQGTARCERGGAEVPVSLTLLEDAPGLVGLVRVQAEWAAVYNAYSVFTARVDDAGIMREAAVIRSANTGTTPRVTEGRLAGDTLSVTMAGIMEGRGNAQCSAATLRRTGPAPAPSPDLMQQIAGNWYVYGFGNPSNRLISRQEVPLRDLPAHTLIEVELVAGENPHALVKVTGAMGRPVAERDRLALSLRPLQIADGPVMFVASRQREGTGRFDLAHPDPSSWIRSPIAIVFEPAIDPAAGLLMRIGHHTIFGVNSEWRYSLSALTDAVRTAMASGVRPPYALAPALGGALAEAPDGVAQCAVLEGWVATHVSPEPSGRSADAQYEQYLPMFLDSAMEPVLGLPIAFLTGSELASISSLMWVCVALPGHPALQTHMRVIEGLMRGSMPDRIVADVATRSDGMDWAGDALAQVAALDPEAAETEAQLTALEAELHQRRDDLTVDQLAGLRSAIAGQREAAMLAVLRRDLAALEQGAPPPGAQPAAGRFDLNALAMLYSRVQAAEALRNPEFDRAGARAIFAHVYEAAGADLLATDPALQWRAGGTPDLAALQASLTYINTLAFHAGKFPAEFTPASFNTLSREAQLQRNQWLQDPAVRQVLAPMLTERAATATREEQLVLAAQDWITPAEVARHGLTAPYLDQIGRNRQEAQISAINIQDISVNNPPGAPTAREIAMAINAHLDGFNDGNDAALAQCRQGQLSQFDPIGALRCAQLETATATGGANINLSYVTKIGCARPGGLPGYLCEFSYGTRSSNIFLQGFLGDAMAQGETVRGQFIQTNIGWVFNRFP